MACLRALSSVPPPPAGAASAGAACCLGGEGGTCFGRAEDFGDAFAARAFLDDASDDGLTPAACALALFWAARRERPLDRPAALAHDGAARSLLLVPPKAPKFGGRKRKHVSRLPSVTVTLAS